MKKIEKITISITFLLLFTAVSSRSAEIRVPSKIIHVTVYRQNARVMHAANAQVPAGIHQLVLEKLTTYLDPNSLQVRLGNAVKVISVTFRTNYLESPDNSKLVKPLKDTLENLNYLAAWIMNSRAIYQGEEKVIRDNTKAYTEQQAVNVTNLSGLVDYYRKRLFEIESELLKLSRQEKANNEKIARIQNLINQYGTNNSVQVGEIVAEVWSPVTANTEIEFSYVTTTAGWYPLYEIRSDGSDKPVVLTYKANIYQNTGYNWDNVSLSVSTGNPNVNNNIPPFYSHYLKFINPVVLEGNLKRVERLEDKRPVSTEQQPSQANVYMWKPDMQNETIVNENQVHTEFDVPLKYNIPSDGLNHLVAMKDYSMPATYDYYAIPFQDKSAFLVARIPEWGKLNLLPGKANLFFENSYIGQTDINPYTTEDTMMVSFGRSEKVTVSRDKVMDFTTIKYVGANKKISYAFDITVRNGKNIPIKMILTDYIPVSTSNDISVDPDELAGAEYNRETGKLTWKLELKPNESRKLRVTYQVKYPKDKVVTGLE